MNVLENIRARLAYFDQLYGPDGDCGESCVFVTVNDLREIVALAESAWEAAQI